MTFIFSLCANQITTVNSRQGNLTRIDHRLKRNDNDHHHHHHHHRETIISTTMRKEMTRYDEDSDRMSFSCLHPSADA